MLNKKFLIGFIIALIALVIVGFIALNFVSNDNLNDLDLSDDANNLSDNATLNISDNKTDVDLNLTAGNPGDVKNASSNDLNKSNASGKDSVSIDAGDVLHKQTFTISENETEQNEGMEAGTYVMYYTENDGVIKIEKVA